MPELWCVVDEARAFAIAGPDPLIVDLIRPTDPVALPSPFMG
jgi:hypothetical protein